MLSDNFLAISSLTFCRVQAKSSPVAQMSTPALLSQHITAGCREEVGLVALESRTEQPQVGASERHRLAVEQKLAGNSALLEAEEALEQGRIGLASARLLVARYLSSMSTLTIVLLGSPIHCNFEFFHASVQQKGNSRVV